ncbi:MAG: SIR2-like domain protein [Firmicutes bacterium]|nr:SIR2-like domain protein [Bacillota bacterium]
MKTAIFLGGGASAAAMAPVQSELFKEYFQLVKFRPEVVNSDMYQEVMAYFAAIFNIDVAGGNLDELSFPTFEEALGILDLAVRRREALRDFDLENISRNSNRIGFLRQYLVLLMAAVLDYKSCDPEGLHRKLVAGLERQGTLEETCFITTNYDLLLDDAVTSYPQYGVDYGIEFVENVGSVEALKKVKLYKIHGSLNWLYCPACNIIRLTADEKGVIRLLEDMKKADCEICRSVMLPVIVPPTFFKDMSNVFLSMVWNKAEQALKEVERIIFCGYSFSDADMHIKYLIKRIQTNRSNPGAVSFYVVNNHPGKHEHAMINEKKRFIRFLGRTVTYTDLSFEEFVADPSCLY